MLSKLSPFFGNVGLIATYLGFLVILIFLAISLAKMIVWPKLIAETRKFYNNGLVFGLDLVLFGALIGIFVNSTSQSLLVFFVVGLIRFVFAWLVMREEDRK